MERCLICTERCINIYNFIVYIVWYQKHTITHLIILSYSYFLLFPLKNPAFFNFVFNTYNTTPFVCKHEGSLIHHNFLIHHKLPNHCSFSTGINFVYAYIILQTAITSDSDKKNPVKEERWMIHIIFLARLALSLMSLSRWIFGSLLRAAYRKFMGVSFAIWKHNVYIQVF